MVASVAAHRRGAPLLPASPLPSPRRLRSPCRPPTTATAAAASSGEADATAASPPPTPPHASPAAWARACVIENRSESGDGAFRTLRLSVADDVPLLSDGVRASVRSKAAGRRWIDGYKAPGQQVGVRLVPADGGDGGGAAPPPPPPRRLVLASSPYEALRESSSLAASIIEIMVDREDGDAFHSALGHLAPGAELDVSTVQGTGWAPMFGGSEGVGRDGGRRDAPALEAALEAGRPLLVIGAGAPGAAALRSTLEWTPVQAAASAGRVAAVLAAGRGGPGGAPYLVWYDLWRGFGVNLNAAALPDACGDLGLEACLFSAVFGGCGGDGGDGGSSSSPSTHPGALRALTGGGSCENVTALVGGCPRPVALAIMRRLEAEGVPSAHILFGDPYF